MSETNDDDAKERGSKIRAALGLDPPLHSSAGRQHYALEKLGGAVDVLATVDASASERFTLAWREVGVLSEDDFETEDAKALFVSARAKSQSILEAMSGGGEPDPIIVRRAIRDLVDAFWVVHADEVRKR